MAKKEKKERKSKKAKKDPNAPKRAISAFFFYNKERRDKLKKPKKRNSIKVPNQFDLDNDPI